MATGIHQIRTQKTSPLVVMKFGGAALSTPDHIMRAANRVTQQLRAGTQVIVVVSAMGDETDRLLSLSQQIFPVATHHHIEFDTVLSAGEQISAGIMALALQAQGVPARSFLGHQIPIYTDGRAGDAQILGLDGQSLGDALAAGTTPVVAGFQGIDANFRTVTLGRGGSDTTAVAVAAALGADVCEFFKDVDGIYSADPLLNSDAKKYNFISYQEMEILAENGAQVLHSKAVRLAAQYQVPLHVRSALHGGEGTRIGLEFNFIEQIPLKKEVCV